MNKRRKQTFVVHTHTHTHIYSYQNKEEILIIITFLIFAMGNVTGIYNYLLAIFPLFSASTSTNLGSLQVDDPYFHS